jgi:hypothetical protein
MVLNGPGTQIAQFDPTALTYRPGPESDYHDALAPLIGQAFADGFTLFETGPLRAIARSSATDVDPNLTHVVHGFDAILVMSGSTPSHNLTNA